MARIFIRPIGCKDKNNENSLFGAERIPSDNQIRNLQDKVEPELVHEVFAVGLKAVDN